MTKKEYNPIIGGGDILAFLNEPAAGTVAATAAKPMPIQKPGAVKSSLNSASEEAFPALGGDAKITESSIAPKTIWASRPTMPLTSSTSVSQTFELPFEQQKNLKIAELGTGKSPKTVSQICSAIASKTKTTIDASTSSKTRAISFIIRGKPADVADAKRQILAELSQPVTIPVEIPSEYLGSVIGASGKIISSIMAETGTKIKVPKKGEEYPGYVIIVGDHDGVMQAKEKIRSIVDAKAKRVVQRLELKAHLLPFVYGIPSHKVGEQPALLSEHYRIKVSHEINREQDEAIITLSGDRDDVALAFNVLSSSLEQTSKTVKSIITAVPKPLHRYLIGLRGANLHEMEAETSCSIHVPGFDSPSDQITIYGAESNLFKGLSLVLEKTSSLDSQVVKVNPDVKLLLLERFRNKFNELENALDVNISKCDSGIQICGFKAKVAKASAEISEMAKPLTNWLFDQSLNVDPKYFGHIIGRKGQNLQQLQTEFGVQVIIPRSSDNLEAAVIIAGPTKKAISDAKESLKSLVTIAADFATVELKVEQKYHDKLIGNRRSNLQKYHEKFPTVAIIFEDGSDVITIKGGSAQVQQAVSMLKEDVETLKHEAIMRGYTVGVDLSPKQQSVILDNNGAVARWVIGVAKDFDIKVFIDTSSSKGKSEHQVLALQGLKKSVEEAQKTIIERATHLENQGTITFDIDQRYHALLIGKGGKNMKHLAKKYQVRASFPALDDTNNNTIEIHGPKNGLEAAKNELVELYHYIVEHRHQIELLVPKAAVGNIVGKGGVGITELALETGTQIDLDKNSDESSEKVRIVITGTEEGVAKAAEDIKQTVNKFESQTSENIHLTASQISKLHDQASFAYRAIVDSFSGNVFFSIQGAKGLDGSLTMRGDFNLVKEAVNQMRNLVDSLDSFITVKIEMPERCFPEIIGTKGENIKRLSKELQVRIDIPRESPKDNVSVSGSKDKVEVALKVISSYAKDEAVIPIESRDVRMDYVARFGKILESKHAGVKISDVREGILIRGPSNSLIDALAGLKIAISNFEADRTSALIHVPKASHGLLIGFRGANAKMLRETTGCRIIIPPVTSSSDDVELVGLPSEVEKAKEEIAKLLASKTLV